MDFGKGFQKHRDDGLVTSHCPLSGGVPTFHPHMPCLATGGERNSRDGPSRFLTPSYSRSTRYRGESVLQL